MKQGSNIRNTLLLFGLFLFLAGTACIPGPAMSQGCPSTNGLIAVYRFDGNGDDSTGYSNPMELQNPSWVDDHLYLNGLYDLDCPITGYRAVGTVPCFNFDAFTVALDFYPTDWGTWMPKSSGEPHPEYPWCGYTSNILTGGTSYRWFRLQGDYTTGDLMLTLNGHISNPHYFQHVFSGTSTLLSINQWHNVVASVDVTNKKIITFLDGNRLEDLDLPSLFVLSTGDEKEVTFTDYSKAFTFQGQVDNLRIYNYALSAAEIAEITPLIDPTRWADLEFIRRIENGALQSAIRRYGSNGSNNLSLSNPASVNSIQATVTIDKFMNIGAFTRARVGGFFYNYDPGSGGVAGDIHAEVGIGDNGSGELKGYYYVITCYNPPECTDYKPVAYAEPSSWGSVNLGETHTLSIAWDGTNQFTFSFDSVSPIIVGGPTNTGPPIFASKYMGTRVGGVVNPSEGGYVDAKLENLRINGDLITFPGPLINKDYWKDLEFVRERINEGVYGMALRSYGSYANNSLNLIDGQKEFQADLTVEELINIPQPNQATPIAALFGSFYNAGGGGPGNSIGDIRALVGIRLNGSQQVGFYNIVRCTAPNCNIYPDEYERLYYHEDPLAIGPDLVGKPHRVSIRYSDESSVPPTPPKFTFGFDGRLTTPVLSLPAKSGPPNVIRMGPITRVAFFSGPGEGSVSAQFANIATVVDTDGDGISDSTDNCPLAYNPGQANTDGDKYGDACDLCPEVNNADTDGDGLADVCGTDVGGGTTAQNQNEITVTFTYNGPTFPTYIVPPDCDGNTVFITDPPIRTNCRRRAPYVMTVLEEVENSGVGRPGGDWVLVTEPTSWEITCDLLKIFDESSLKAAEIVKITPMYNFLLGDPGINPDTGQCAEGDICVDTDKYDLFQGTIAALPIRVVTKNFSEIDIKPGTYPNTINLGSEGSVPVAIFSRTGFDATKIDVSSLRLERAEVVKIKGKYQASNGDVNRDGLRDKIVHFYTKGLAGVTTGFACVTGTYKGEQFKGCDFVTIVP